MRLAFDIQPLLTTKKTGIGYYGEGLLGSLMRKHPNHIYTLCYFSREKDVLHTEEKIRASLNKYNSLGGALNQCNWFSDKLYRMIQGFIPVPFRLFFGSKDQVTHFFNFIVPPGVKGKKVVTVHDMCYKACPETVRIKTKYMLRLNLKKSCNRADKIIAVSHFSKQEIMKYLGIDSKKIEVVYNGIDHNIFHSRYTKGQIQETQLRYGTSSDYFIYLGTLEPRKNIKKLVEAYGLLVLKYPSAPMLVLAGGKGWIYNDLEGYIDQLGLNKRVIFTGYVNEADVPLLLSGAFAFVFPSIYEGFGLPPLEAMACGTPVLTSNTSSLPEVVEGCAIMVNPNSAEEIADGMRKLIEDENLCNELSQKGLVQAQKFTWEQAAVKTMEVYQSLVSEA